MIETYVYNMASDEYLSVIRLYNVNEQLSLDMVNEIYEIYKKRCLDNLNKDENFLKIAMINDIMAARGYVDSSEMTAILNAFEIDPGVIDCLAMINSVIALRFNLDLEQTTADLLTVLKNDKIGKHIKLIYAKAVLNFAIVSPIFNTVAPSISEVIEYINTFSTEELDAASVILSHMINKMEA